MGAQSLFAFARTLRRRLAACALVALCAAAACARGGAPEVVYLGSFGEDAAAPRLGPSLGAAADGAVGDDQAADAESDGSTSTRDVGPDGESAPSEGGPPEGDATTPIDTGVVVDGGPGWADASLDAPEEAAPEGGHDARADSPAGSPACAASYNQADCFNYITGTTQVSSNSHNWSCSGPCANCADNSTCAPGKSGCPWGRVWTDEGACH